jgi:hypothetical protein
MTNFEPSSSRDGVNVWHSVAESERVDVNRTTISFTIRTRSGKLTGLKTGLRCTHSLGPMLLLEHNVYVP